MIKKHILHWAAVCVLIVTGSLIALGQNVTRGPYLQTATPTNIVIRWRTDEPAASLVRYGTDPSKLDQIARSPGLTTEHIVLVPNLTPDTKYFYSVGTTDGVLAGGDAAHHFISAPKSGAAKPARVWVIGDAGTKNADQRAVRDGYYKFAGNRPTDVWLMLGDNAYNRGTDEEYQAAVFDMYSELLRKSAVWPTLGNHDAGAATSVTQSGVYYDIFTLPTLGQAGGLMSGTEAYYAFDYGQIHFICLDSHDTDRSADGAMMTWLKHDLAANTKPWIIAFWHHPPYTKGSHDSDNDNDSDGRMNDMREIALPILESYGVDLVLTGHSHSYERSFLLDGHYGKSDTLTQAMIKNRGDGRADGQGAYGKPTLGPGAHEGAVYVVAGSSGKTTGKDAGRIKRGFLNHPAKFISLYELGSLVLDIDGNRLDATFLDEKGNRQDYFSIVKGDSKAAPAP